MACFVAIEFVIPVIAVPVRVVIAADASVARPVTPNVPEQVALARDVAPEIVAPASVDSPVTASVVCIVAAPLTVSAPVDWSVPLHATFVRVVVSSERTPEVNLRGVSLRTGPAWLRYWPGDS